MNKAVLISIQPKWCELIASGEKTVEVRKTKPKLDVPFKVYIYCTKDESLYHSGEKFWCKKAGEFGNGKVIGEFVCDKMLESFLNNNDGWFIEKGCLTQEEIDKYQGDKSILYGWHISDLVIYDDPKELSEFSRPCNGNCQECEYALWQTYTFISESKIIGCTQKVKAPQSWCYVEEGRQ